MTRRQASSDYATALAHSGRRVGLFVSLSLAVVCLGVALGAVTSGASSALRTHICGKISEDATWTLNGSPYDVTCDTVLPPGVTLTIEPGVELRFSAGSGLVISGTLLAGGEPGRPITFTSGLATPAPGNWDGLRFVSGSSGSHLAWCVVEYAATGLHVYAGPGETVAPSFSDCVVRRSAQNGIKIVGYASACDEGVAQPTITRCLVEENGAGDSCVEDSCKCGIFGYGYGDEWNGCHGEFIPGGVGGSVSGSRIRQNQGPGICLQAKCDGLGHGDVWTAVEANAISGNGGHGVHLYGNDPISDSVHPSIENNVIYGNAQAGIQSDAKHEEKECSVVNNTVFDNGGDGIVFKQSAALVRLANNIVAANGGYALVCEGSAYPQTAANDLWNNAGDYSVCTPGSSDLHADPLLLDATAGDFHLPFHSPCVDAGTGDGAPATDIEGIARPQGAGVDIGAHELWYRRTYLPLIQRD
jgi:hypothetical protein